MRSLLKVLSFSFLGVLLAFVVFSSTVYAQSNFREGKQTILPKSEVVNENYFATGETIQISGTVNGDVYAVGGNILIDGTINGDLLAVGGTLQIGGKIAGNVRVAGGQISVSGDIGKNVSAAGGQITFDDSAKLLGSITAAGGNIDVKTQVPGSLEIGGGNLIINNKVGKNVNFAGGNLQLGSLADVGGNVTYYSETAALITDGAKIKGETKQNLPPKEFKEAREAGKRSGPAFFRFWMMTGFFSALVIGLLLAKFVPGFTQKTADNIKSKFLANLGIGFIAVVVTPIAVFILFVTLLGIPLGFILLMGYLFVIYVAKIFVAVFAGQLITRRAFKTKSLYLDILFGLMIFYLLGFVPILGWIVQTVFVLASVGSILMTKKEVYKSLSGKI